MLVDTHGHTSFAAHNSRRRVKRGATEGSSPPWTSTSASGTLPRFINKNQVCTAHLCSMYLPGSGEFSVCCTLSHLTKHGSTCT